jgi:hypothetical protein
MLICRIKGVNVDEFMIDRALLKDLEMIRKRRNSMLLIVDIEGTARRIGHFGLSRLPSKILMIEQP